MMAGFIKLYEIDYGSIGQFTTGYGDESLSPHASFKIEWTPLKHRIRIDEAKVIPFMGEKGIGLGTKAWGLFESEHLTDKFVLTAGFKDWSGTFNKLACEFWLKMGFTFVKNKSGKCSGKPQQMKKIVR